MSNFLFRSQGFRNGWLPKYRHSLSTRTVKAKKIPIHQMLACLNPDIGFRDDVP